MQKIVKLNQAFLYCCMVVMFCLHSQGYAAPTQGKPVSITIKNSTLAEVLRQVSKKSGLYIYFQDADLAAHKNVTIDVRNKPVENVLHELLDGRGLSWVEVSENTIAVKKKLEVEDKRIEGDTVATITVTGKVVDEKGEPVIGANISVKGSKNGTATNSNGQFILKNVQASSAIIITNVAFLTQEVNLRGRNFLGEIRLKEYVSVLDEAQIIAYGTTTRRTSTSPITTLKAKDIENQPINNPLLAIQGRLSGIEVTQQTGLPGGKLTVRIRGQNGLNGSEPLYIVDGVPIDPNVFGAPSSLSPDLQGSAFQFLNSSDIESIDILKDADASSIYGSRGANGVILITTKRGREGRAKINISASTGVGEVTRKMRLLDTRQYLDMRYEALKNDGISIDDPFIAANDLKIWDTTRYTDWQRELIGGTSNFTNIQTSVSGGNSNVQYWAGGGFTKETSVLPGKFSDSKGNAQLSITGNSSNQKFQIQVKANYVLDKNTLPGVDFTSDALTLAPNAPKLYNDNGTLNWENSTWSNPLSRIYTPYEFTNNNLIASSSIGYKVLSGLEMKVSLGYNKLVGEAFTGTPFNAINPTRWTNPLNRRATFVNTNASFWVAEPQITFNKLLLSKLKVDVLVGGSWQQSAKKVQNISARGFSSDALLRDIASATTYSTNPVANNRLEYKYCAAFGRVNLNWDGKYLLNLSLRRDGSSRFGPKNQFGSFGSVGIAWNFSDEKFIKDNFKIISFGKIRSSYGTTGNDQISDYKYLDLYTSSGLIYQGSKGLISNGLYDPYYAWEETRKANIGLDLGIWNDGVVLTFDYYRNRSSNQLIGADLPSFVGPGAPIINRNALTQSAGIEISLSLNCIKAKEFQWSTSLNLSKNESKLISYPGIESSIDYFKAVIGKPLTRERVFHLINVDRNTGEYRFEDADGKATISPNDPFDRTVFVNLAPKYMGGLQNTLSYKGFTFDCLFQFVNQMGKNYPGNFIPGFAEVNQPTTVLNRWQKPGDDTKVAKFTQIYNYDPWNNAVNQSDYAYTNASFIRLKNLSLSYSVQGQIKRQLQVTDFRIFILGQNLLTITNYTGLDPENRSSTSLPPLRVLTAGVRLTL